MEVFDFFFGLLVIGVSVMIGIFFYNPYGCDESCIGCENIFELFADNWSNFVSAIGVIFGLFYLVYFGIERENKV